MGKNLNRLVGIVMNAQLHREKFANQMERAELPGVKPDDWGNLLSYKWRALLS